MGSEKGPSCAAQPWLGVTVGRGKVWPVLLDKAEEGTTWKQLTQSVCGFEVSQSGLGETKSCDRAVELCHEQQFMRQ